MKKILFLLSLISVAQVYSITIAPDEENTGVVAKYVNFPNLNIKAGTYDIIERTGRGLAEGDIQLYEKDGKRIVIRHSIIF